jgi:GT2 family glycosyltransferase
MALQFNDNQGNSPLVSIITINYNHSDITVNCVNSILLSDYPDFFLIVVDNGSHEDDYKNLKIKINYSKVLITRIEKNLGYVGGINHGLQYASQYNPDYYLIMNNDTILDKDSIKSLVETSKKYNDKAIVSGKVYNMDEPNTLQYIGQKCVNLNKFQFPSYVKGMREEDVGQFDMEIEMGMLDDIFWILPKNIYQAVGLYSTDYFLYGEQNDYALRAVKKGFRLIYTPKAKIWHYLHMTTSSGILMSQKILYWQSFATLVLAFRHLPLHYFIRLYLKSTANLILDYCKSTFINKNRTERNYISARLVGVFYFSLWIFHRRPNTGFNPYI